MTYIDPIDAVISAEWSKLRTDDEVNLRAEFEGKELVAHELVHLNGFNDAELCCTLSEESLRTERSSIE